MAYTSKIGEEISQTSSVKICDPLGLVICEREIHL